MTIVDTLYERVADTVILDGTAAPVTLTSTEATALLGYIESAHRRIENLSQHYRILDNQTEKLREILIALTLTANAAVGGLDEMIAHLTHPTCTPQQARRIAEGARALRQVLAQSIPTIGGLST